MKPPRRKASELNVLYKLNNGVRDIFTEGQYDKHIYSRIFKDLLPVGSTVHADGDIEIDLYPEPGTGCKDRVLKLCTHLNHADIQNIHGIIDNDTDTWTNLQPSPPNISRTTYTSIEFHLSDINTIKTTIENFFHKEIESLDVDAVSDISRTLFCIRIIGEKSEKPYAFPDISSSIKFAENKIKLNTKDFLVRMDSRNKTGSYFLDKIHQITANKNEMPSDSRLCVNFHDFELVFGITLKKKYNIKDYVNVPGWLSRLINLDLSKLDRTLSPFAPVELYLKS